MGTNYYMKPEPPCEKCGRQDEGRHIGKSSGGWCFSLHVYPEDGIRDLPDWEREWNTPGVEIRDEYGRTITAPEMRGIVTDRGGRQSPITAEWQAQNGAVTGPFNLARHRIGRFCVGHGEGTWDLMVGEFS